MIFYVIGTVLGTLYRSTHIVPTKALWDSASHYSTIPTRKLREGACNGGEATFPRLHILVLQGYTCGWLSHVGKVLFPPLCVESAFSMDGGPSWIFYDCSFSTWDSVKHVLNNIHRIVGGL